MKTHVLILLALLVVPLFCVTAYVREIIAVDSALDAGASFDYAAGRADYTANHPFVPFSHRHGTLLVLSALSLGAAVAYGSYAVSARLRSRAI